MKGIKANVREHRHRHRHQAMISVEEALGRILSHFDVLDAEEKPLLDALGQVLAEDVVAPFDVPPWDNSAMDGYAVQAASVKGATKESPVVLRVAGTVAAGELPSWEVTRGTAARIMTGAPIPKGADAVVPFEDTDETERKAAGQPLTEVAVAFEVRRGDDVRPAGQDVSRGELVLTKGTVLGPADVGVLASLGRSAAQVIRRPVVAILATGNELIEPGSPYVAGKIYDSNSYSIAAAVARCGGIPRPLGIAGDTLVEITSSVGEALSCDLLITSAGVSKGDYDIVKDVLARRGKIELWSVRMRPAKPLAFGVLRTEDGRGVPLLGLPGNPASALVAFEQFGRAAIRKMMGKGLLPKPTVDAVLEEPIHNTDGRRVYARVVVTKRNGTYYARLTGPQSSNLLTSMARANGLAICPDDVPIMEEGAVVKVQMIDWPEEVF